MSLICAPREMFSSIFGTMYDLFGNVNTHTNCMSAEIYNEYDDQYEQFGGFRFGNDRIPAVGGKYTLSLFRHGEDREEGDWALKVDCPWHYPHGMIHDVNCCTYRTEFQHPRCIVTFYPEDIDSLKDVLNYFAQKIKERNLD